MSNKIKIELWTYGYRDKKVSPSGKSGRIGRVYLPKEWVGKKVIIALTESLEESFDSTGKDRGRG